MSNIDIKELKENIKKEIDKLNEKNKLEYIYFTIKGIRKSSC